MNKRSRGLGRGINISSNKRIELSCVKALMLLYLLFFFIGCNTERVFASSIESIPDSEDIANGDLFSPLNNSKLNSLERELRDYSNIEQSKVLLGVWDGYYFASQGKTALQLDIQSLTLDGKVEAQFNFSEHPDNPGVPTGSYTMTGTYDFIDHKLSLNGDKWIEHPSGYYMLSVKGEINMDERTMGGTTGGYPDLTLSKSGSDLNVFTIEVQSSDGGVIQPKSGIYVQEGATKSFEIKPNKGFSISYVEVDDVNMGVMSKYDFENVTDNHRIAAYFRQADPNVVTYINDDIISINYSGYAYAHVHLVDANGNPLVDKGEELSYNTENGINTVTVDDKGYIDVKSDLYTYSNSEDNRHRFNTSVKNSFGDEVATVNINNIVVKDISFSQKWEGKMDVSGTAKAGIGAGFKIGPADASATLGDIGATKSRATTMEVENSYKDGKRNLNISQKYDRKVAVKGAIGPSAEALNNAIEIKAVEASASGGVGQQVSSGIKIKNYDPSNPDSTLKIGKYVLFGAAESAGNVLLMKIVNLLGYEGTSDVIGSKVSLEGKGGVDFLKFKAKGNIGGEISAISAETGGVYSFEASRDRSGQFDPINSSPVLYTKKKSYTRNGSINVLDTSIKAFKDNPVKFKTGFHGPYFDDKHVTDVAVSGKIDGLSDTNQSRQNITKITIGGTSFSDGGIGDSDLHSVASEVSHKVVYDGENAQIVVNRVPAVGNFYENFIYGLSKDDINKIEQCKTAKATFEDEYKEKTTVNVPLELGLKLGLAIEAGLKLKGVHEESYTIDGGIYNYDDSIGGREEVKTNTCDSITIENKINGTKEDIQTILAEPIINAARLASDFFVEAKGKAGEVIKNGFAKIYNDIIDKTVHIESIKSGGDETSVNPDAALSSSYEISTYTESIIDSALGMASTESIASTVGDPYIVYLTDDNGNEVYDWNGETLKLELGYTNDMLAAAGATVNDASGLAIYRYSHEKLGYIYKGGVVDTTSQTVTLDITEGGQYILAIDNVAPTVYVFTTEDDSNPPVIIAGIDELSGLSELSLKLDDEELVNLSNYDEYFDANSGAITVPVKKVLSPGIHKATLMATDLAGNSMAVPAELEIEITAKSKELQLDANGGTVVPTKIKRNIGDVYGDLPIPTREGYSFIGWFTERDGGEKITSETIVEDNGVELLYAHWSTATLSNIILEAEQNDFTMLPGETRRLSVSKTNQYIYGIKWVINNASPKGCITLKNGVVTAKKVGTARVTASYGSSSATFHINVDGKTYKNTVISEGKKKYKITATKNVNMKVGSQAKTVSISIPANMRKNERVISYKITNNGVCSVGNPVYNKADRSQATKATFKVTPLEAGATWIIWSMKDENGKETQAATKVIVKKPLSELQFSEASTSLEVGEGKRLIVTGTKANTDAKDLTFSVKGKGVKISKSGFVLGTIPGSKATITVKSGNTSASMTVNVADFSGNYLTLNKNAVSIAKPKSGSKQKSISIKVATPKNKKDQPDVNWSVIGSPNGISISDGRLIVTSNAYPGCYIIMAEPEASSGYNKTFCELVVK